MMKARVIPSQPEIAVLYHFKESRRERYCANFFLNIILRLAAFPKRRWGKRWPPFWPESRPWRESRRLIRGR